LAQQVTGGFAVGLTFGAGCSGGAALQVLRGQRTIARCGSDGGADDEAEQALDVASSPLQLSVGPGAGRFSRGAVVGNAAILAACCVVTVLAMLLKGCSACDLSMPGLLYVPWGFLGVPTLTAAIDCLVQASKSSTEDADRGDAAAAETSPGANVAIGLLGVAAAVAPVAALVRTACFRFHARPYRVAPKRPRMSMWRRLYRYYSPNTEHEDTEQAGFVDGWDFSGVLDYQKGKQWVAVVEPVLGVLTGVLAAVAAEFGSSSSSGLCKGINALELAAAGGSLALLLLVKPHSVAADREVAVITAVVQTFTAFCGLLGRDATSYTEPGLLLLSGLHFAGSIAWAAVDKSSRMLLAWRHRRRRRRVRRAEPAAAAMNLLTGDELAALQSLSREGPAGEAARRDALKQMLTAITRAAQPVLHVPELPAPAR
jgi:hypothetical protein